jgi:hypothetical protein
MLRAWSLGIVVVSLVICGCGNKQTTSPTSPPQNPERLSGRLDAANKLANAADRHAALKVVALDAADAGAVDIVTKAIEGIPVNAATGPKDEVAAACATKLAHRGDTKAATTLAETIANTQKKNEVLANIAKGSS